MKVLPHRSLGLAVLWFACAGAMAYGCDRLPPGQVLWVRLAKPISTYSAKVGDPVHTILTQDLVCDSEVILPMGTVIDGIVRKKHKVGWGIEHETASLEVEFKHAAGPDIDLALTARVDEVENARESVRNGVIRGIRSSDTLQGSINSRLIHMPTWNPYSDPVLMIYKAVFPIFPEPEIYFPAGTDIRLRTTAEIVPTPSMSASFHEPMIEKADSDQFDQLVKQLPWRVLTKKNVDADLLNIVFLGSESQVKSAFREAGWHTADPASKGAWGRNLYALLNNSGYAQQPMMTFYLNGKPEDMNWQKNLNSYGRRDHLRIWRWKTSESADTVWLTSSTHDTGAVLDVRHKGFVHHISPYLDEERATVIRDLNFAGCVKSVGYVQHPQIPTATRNAIGDIMRSDGWVAVITLQDCRSANPQLASTAKSVSFRPGNYTFRYIRRQILTFRNDIWRANIIYGSYDAGRMAVTALRHKPSLEELPGTAHTEPPSAHLPLESARSLPFDVPEEGAQRQNASGHHDAVCSVEGSDAESFFYY
jgi:hypothetical protein